MSDVSKLVFLNDLNPLGKISSFVAVVVFIVSPKMA